eukprot:gene29458-5803_t
MATKAKREAIDAKAEAMQARIQTVRAKNKAEMAKMEAEMAKSEERKAWAAVKTANEFEKANTSIISKMTILTEGDTTVVIAECEKSASYKNELHKARIELQLMYSYLDIFSIEMDNLVASLEDCLPGHLPLRNGL